MRRDTMLTSHWGHKSRGAVSQQRHKATRASPHFTPSAVSSSIPSLRNSWDSRFLLFHIRKRQEEDSPARVYLLYPALSTEECVGLCGTFVRRTREEMVCRARERFFTPPFSHSPRGMIISGSGIYHFSKGYLQRGGLPSKTHPLFQRNDLICTTKPPICLTPAPPKSVFI